MLDGEETGSAIEWDSPYWTRVRSRLTRVAEDALDPEQDVDLAEAARDHVADPAVRADVEWIAETVIEEVEEP